MALIALMLGPLVLLATERLAMLRVGEDWFADFRVATFSPVEPQHPQIIVLAIDEATLAGFPYRSPLARGFLAALVDWLGGAGVRAIALDVLFDQPTVAEDDLRLAEALHGVEVPLVVATASEAAGLSEAQLAFQASYVEGLRTGSANLLKDPDGVVRRILSWRPGAGGDVLQPSLPFALAEALGAELPDGDLPLAYRRSESGETPFRVFPSHVAARGLLPREWFADAIVLVGADLPHQDRHRTPLGRSQDAGGTTPGVVIHAHAVAQLLDGRRLPVPSTGLALLTAIAVACVGACLGWLPFPLWLRVTAGLLFLTGFAAGCCWLFASGGPLLPVIGPGLAFAASVGGAAIYVGRQHRAGERFLRHAFGHYISERVIENIVSQPEALELGGEKREMSFLFTDVAGFTTLSEGLPPDRLVSVLQEYLDGLVEVALRHEGTIEKFIGDAIYVIFGAPAVQSDHARRAVDCALDMDRFCEGYRQAREREEIPFGLTRIGVHSGVAVVGNIGGRRRFDYTAIGDSVNTAARLESVNKALGTRVCISKVTAAACPGLELWPVGQLVLKGKEKGIEVLTPAERAGAAPTEEYLEAYGRLAGGTEKAAEALECFARLTQTYPDDGLVAFHHRRLDAGQVGTRIVLESK